MAHVYRITRSMAPNVYLPSRQRVKQWIKLNPSEAQQVERVEVMEELELLANEVYEQSITVNE